MRLGQRTEVLASDCAKVMDIIKFIVNYDTAFINGSHEVQSHIPDQPLIPLF